MIDRGLMLLTKASAADADLEVFDRDVTKLADDLAFRFGAPHRQTVH